MTLKEAQNHTYELFTLKKRVEELSKVKIIVDCPNCIGKMHPTGEEFESYPGKLEVVCDTCQHENTIYSSEI